MPDKPSHFGQFWQELKRRNVTHVLAVYIAVAFMLLELVSIIEEPFGLPDWSLRVAFYVLIAGFFITIIISWIYDVTPGGVEKTKPLAELKPGERDGNPNSWKIASYISFTVIIALIFINIIPNHNRLKELANLDKSIAVLPFINDSPDEENAFFINGIMDELIINLQSIEDLRVLDRISVEQYRDNQKPPSEIAKELGVNFIVGGSGQKYGMDFILRVQLLEGETGMSLWAKSIREIIENIEDIINIQSSIAVSIAEELNAVITPAEKQIIEKIPTTSQTAYYFYMRGKEELIKYHLNIYNRELLVKSEDFFRKALDYDAAFAQAYTGLAQVYREKHYYGSFLTENFLDSMKILADIALSYDDQLAESYVIRGDYYESNYNKEQALSDYNKAIILNPNYWRAYWQKGELYYYDDLVNTLENHHKAAFLQRGPLLPNIYRKIGLTYAMAGFKDKSIYYVREAYKLDDDPALYFRYMAEIEDMDGNFEKAVEFGEKSYDIDSTDWGVIFLLGIDHLYLGHFDEYFRYFKKYDAILKSLDIPHPWGTFRLGHAHWMNENKEEAEYYFNTGLEYFIEMTEMGRHYGQDFGTYYVLAAMYTFMGDKDKAYENLRLVNQRQRMPAWVIKDITNDPLFDNFRDDIEFQQIVKDIETKYQIEQNQVKKWLEENDML